MHKSLNKAKTRDNQLKSDALTNKINLLLIAMRRIQEIQADRSKQGQNNCDSIISDKRLNDTTLDRC